EFTVGFTLTVSSELLVEGVVEGVQGGLEVSATVQYDVDMGTLVDLLESPGSALAEAVTASYKLTPTPFTLDSASLTVTPSLTIELEAEVTLADSTVGNAAASATFAFPLNATGSFTDTSCILP
ncbi:hypothetical protein KIPB_015799, partial [Kipferlia bialata]